MTATGTMDIDIVVTYVDGAVPGFLEEHERATGRPPSPCHVRTLGELRYVLRSIDAHVPWARHVILAVKDRSHVPGWVDTGQVRVVTHDDFIPDEHLPVFSPYPIQANVHRIPGVSSTFLLWSDDKLALTPLAKSDFFLPDGEPHLAPYVWAPLLGRLRGDDRFHQRLARSRALISDRLLPSEVGAMARRLGLFLIPHMPIAIESTRFQEMLDRCREDPAFQETITSATRDSTRAREIRQTVMELWCAWRLLVAGPSWWQSGARLALNLARSWLARMGVGEAIFAEFAVTNDPSATRREMAGLAATRATFVNVKDMGFDRFVDRGGQVYHTQPAINPASQALLLEALEGRFPAPSRFERASTG